MRKLRSALVKFMDRGWLIFKNTYWCLII